MFIWIEARITYRLMHLYPQRTLYSFASNVTSKSRSLCCVEKQRDEGEGEEHSLWNRHEPYSAQNPSYANWRILSIGNWFTLIHPFTGVAVMHPPPHCSPASRQIKFIRPSFLSVLPSISLIRSPMTKPCCWLHVCAMLTWSIVTKTKRQTVTHEHK